MTAPLEIVVAPSAARTATANFEPADRGSDAEGVIVVIDVTAASATPSVVFTIQGYSAAGDDWYDLLSSAAITGVGTTRLQVAPDLTASANAKASELLPSRWRVRAVHADADSITYSIGATLVPA